jgi:hypothetical protein
MRKRVRTVIAAASAVVGFTAAHAQAQFTYVEQGSSAFGSATLPPEAQEFFSSTFNGVTTFRYDTFGRVISNAEVTATPAPGPLTTITMRLWSVTDADLYKIKITDPATFSATIPSTTNILSLFAADGTALAASRGGGAANAITGASLAPGEYFIGESQASGAVGGATFGLPRNDAGQPLFDFSTDGVKLPIAQADMKLSTDPFEAFTTNNGSFLIGNSTFTSPGTTITLTGATAVLVPEPAIAAAAAVGAIATGVVVRRRRARRA